MSSPLLLVDNSNTRTKFALVAPGAHEPSPPRSCPTAELSPAAIRRVLSGWSFSHAVLCSVAPRAAAILRESLGCPISEITAACCPRLLRGYPSPDSLGPDRIANAAAVAAYYPLPCIAVDLGTACTFDLVVADADGPRFAGGAISPGIHTAAHSLADKTARLPHFSAADLREPPPPGACGLSTKQAMLAGLRYGFQGMVRGVIEQMSRALHQQPHVVLTGGDAELLAHLEPFNTSIDKQLTIKGILHIHKNNDTLFCPSCAK